VANRKIPRLKDLLNSRRGSHERWMLGQNATLAYLARPGQAVGSAGGNGVTKEMRSIEGPTIEVVHGDGTTYTNPARDLRKGRKLRRELRSQ